MATESLNTVQQNYMEDWIDAAVVNTRHADRNIASFSNCTAVLIKMWRE